MEKPRKLTKYELHHQFDRLIDFCDHHNVNLDKWGEVFTPEWYTVDNTEKYRYTKYCEWYNKQYSKLGKALK